jgi:hypothetical protein
MIVTIIIILVGLFLACMAWVIYEAITAPTMDENEQVIKDPYHRCKK